VLGLRFVNQPPANPSPGTSRELQSGVWLALDGVYFAGGHTTLNGVKGDNEQQSTRAGFTLAVPVDRQNSLKLHVSTLSDEVSQARFLAFRFGQRRNTSNTLGDPRTRWEQMDALAARRVLRVFSKQSPNLTRDSSAANHG